MMFGKGCHSVWQMSNITHHATTHCARGTNRNVGQGAIEGTESQPGFGWQLQGTVVVVVVEKYIG